MSPGNPVLVVEDDDATRQLLVAVVERNRLIAIPARDGQAAVALLRGHDFGAILLDLLLPELNGFEVLRLIACDRPELLPRVMVVTAAHSSLWANSPYLDKIRKVVVKPFEDMGALERDIVDCCNGH
jgi:CheY-like chemotaxis protein